MRSIVKWLLWISGVFVLGVAIYYTPSNGSGVLIKGILYFLFSVVVGWCICWNPKKQDSSDPVVPSPADPKTSKGKSFSFPVVGVTFKNDDGSDRQKLLRKLYFQDPPFDGSNVVSLEKYVWKNSPAYYVKVNDSIVGNIEADYVWYFEKNSDRPCDIEISVYGGTAGKNYGAEIKGIYKDN